MKRNGITVLGLLCAMIAHGEPVTGEYSYNFSATNLPLFDLKGSFVTNLGGIGEQFTIELSPRGRIGGRFSAQYDDGIIAIDLTGTIAGRLSSAPPQYPMVFGGRGSMRGTAYGRPISGSESFRIQLEADLTTGMAIGSQHVTACVAGRGCRSMSEPVSFEMGELTGGVGDWSLRLNITNINNRIGGLAQATLSSGRAVDFRVRGTYSSSQAVSQLQLRGIDSATGVSLRVTTDSAMNLLSMRGKLFGQRTDM